MYYYLRLRLLKAFCYRRLTMYTNHISNTDYVDVIIVCLFLKLQSGTVKDGNRHTPKLSTKHRTTLHYRSPNWNWLETYAQCLLSNARVMYLIFVVPSIMHYSSEINPTICNNCVFILRSGFTLHVSGDNLTHHQEYICCIWPQVSRLT